MFGMVDSYAPGVAPAKGSGFTGDVMPVKLLVQPNGATISGTFVPDVAGRYLVVLQGAGGPAGGGNQGGPGALAARVVRLRKAQGLPYVVSAAYAIGSVVDCTVAFADRIMTAGKGQQGVPDSPEADPPVVGHNGAGGVASGGDVNLNGVQGAAQAPSYGPFIGGAKPGGADNNHIAGVPGGPGIGVNVVSQWGAAGRLTICYIGP